MRPDRAFDHAFPHAGQLRMHHDTGPPVLNGFVSGESAFERGVRLAGALAELGAGQVQVVHPGQAGREARPLPVRETDLPGELERLAQQGGGTLRVPVLGLTFEIGPSTLRWRAESEDAARSLAARLSEGTER